MEHTFEIGRRKLSFENPYIDSPNCTVNIGVIEEKSFINDEGILNLYVRIGDLEYCILVNMNKLNKTWNK